VFVWSRRYGVRHVSHLGKLVIYRAYFSGESCVGLGGFSVTTNVVVGLSPVARSIGISLRETCVSKDVSVCVDGGRTALAHMPAYARG